MMSRYIAFLRAINVGGHTVKMETLRQLFQGMGFTGVETFIASGNVVFEAPSQEPRLLEERIMANLRGALGYEVATFLRTGPELVAIANYQAFPPEALAAAATFNIAFLADPLDPMSIQKLMALKSDLDDFHVHGREVYWLCRVLQSQSTFSNAVLEKTTGRPSTLRGAKTIKKMAAQFSGF
jgi:uncharacterized protein (DUF1697 family)